jgi:hypothetical protein
MKLFLHALIVFFGTLLTAGLVALGAPGNDEAPAVPLVKMALSRR